MNISNKKYTFPWIEKSTITKIVSALKKKKQHKFAFVGGCVRDSLIKKEFDDYDIASNFSPEQNTLLLNKQNIKVLDTGIKYGTITAIVDHQPFQITTLRTDLTIGRQPEVEFIGNFFDDAKRRDFTFNALYFNPITFELNDYFNGLQDLLNKKINFIGKPQDRIKEDYLRILRYFRFFCYYANNIDNNVLNIIREEAKNLQKLSKNRIYQEFHKILLHENPKNTLLLMYKYQVFNYLFKINDISLNNFDNLIILENILGINKDIVLRSAFIIDDCKEIDKFIIKSNHVKVINKIILIKNCIIDNKITSYQAICELVVNHGYVNVINALIILASNDWNNKNHYIEIIKKLNNKAREKFPLNGKDLLNMNIKEEYIGYYNKKIQTIFWQYPLKEKKEYLNLLNTLLKKEHIK